MLGVAHRAAAGAAGEGERADLARALAQRAAAELAVEESERERELGRMRGAHAHRAPARAPQGGALRRYAHRSRPVQ
jgi:hypothetical protein